MEKFIKKHPGDCIVGYMKMIDIGVFPYQREVPVLFIKRIDENGVLHKEYISSVTIIDDDIYYEK